MRKAKPPGVPENVHIDTAPGTTDLSGSKGSRAAFCQINPAFRPPFDSERGRTPGKHGKARANASYLNYLAPMILPIPGR